MDYTTLGKEPIPGDNPAGSDVRYEPEFEALQAEIDKIASPTATGGVDWSKVVEVAGDILATKSKDLTVASYLAVGLVRTRKIEGFDQGLQVLKDMVESHWDKLFPAKKRMRGRAGAFTWWLEKTAEVLEKYTPDNPLPAEQAQRIQENLKAVDGLLMDKMPDPPMLRPVMRQVERYPVQAPEPETPEEPAAPQEVETAAPAPKPVAPAPPAAPKAPRPEPAAEVPETPETEQDARKSVDAALTRISQASRFLLKNDLKNPLAYRYRRMASWSKVTALPPNTDGATQIPPPPPQVMGALNELIDAGNWPALIQNVEQKLSQFIFWFDLSYLVAEGLKSLGAGHEKALTAVCQETAYLVQRLPGVEALGFSDGTPFADSDTRKWLQRIRFGEGGAGATGTGTADDGGDSLLSDSIAKARTMARKKQLVAAIDLLQQEMGKSSSRCFKMRWRLAIAEVLLSVKKSQLALPHLEQILADIDEFNLEIWDPSLAMEGLSTAWKGFNALSADEHKAQATALLHRLAKIDPAEALRLSK